MRADLLEWVSQRGGIHLFHKKSQDLFEESWLFSCLEDLGVTTIIVDLQNQFPHAKNADASLLDAELGRGGLVLRTSVLQENIHLCHSGITVFPTDPELKRLRFFLINLQRMRERYGAVILLLPEDPSSLWLALKDQTSTFISKDAYWLDQAERILGSRALAWELDAKKLSNAMREARRLHVLLQNPPSVPYRIFQKYWWIGAILFTFFIFFYPTSMENPRIRYQDWSKEIAQLQKQSGYPIEFTGQETLFRAARHALGRLTGRAASEQDVQRYLQEIQSLLPKDTLKGKTDPSGKWMPDSGMVIRFPMPQDTSLSRNESSLQGWRFMTQLLSDSLSYITEYYDPTGRLAGRRHMGVDIAGRHGSRILAPFGGKAWTTYDERGGEVIALVHNNNVLLFMHCDQILYLDGQEVLAGDPLATVGMTGHTTGPHVHFATGLVNAKGSKSLGNIRYDLIDPSKWVLQYLSK